jgi:hypothetical protein
MVAKQPHDAHSPGKPAPGLRNFQLRHGHLRQLALRFTPE